MELFGIKVLNPIEKANVKVVAGAIPAWMEDKIEIKKMTLAEARSALNEEVGVFLNKLEQHDAELFLDLFEEAASALAHEVDEKSDGVPLEQKEWSFYIRFQVSRPLGIDECSILFLDKYVIESDSGGSLKAASVLRLRNLEHMVWKEIAQSSQRVEQALILAFAELGVGIAYLDNLASAAALEKTKKKMENYFHKQHTKIEDDYFEIPLIHWSDKFGVVHFPTDSIGFDTKATQEVAAIDAEKFNISFESYYNQLQKLIVAKDEFKRIKTATSILTTSLFDESLINRIILSMTAIEVLSEKKERSDAELKVLDFLTDKLNDIETSAEVKKSIKSGLESLRIQSIGRNCRALVKELLSKKEAEIFHNLYNYRSQLVHAGALTEGQGEMYRVYVDSYRIANKVINAYIEKMSSAQIQS